MSYLTGRLTLASDVSTSRIVVNTGSALHLETSNLYDACFTSPPYATRVDYPRATLAELSVLGLHAAQVDALRRASTGTPTVRGHASVKTPLSSLTAARIVADVASHASHGSSHYYGPWILNYFSDLERSLLRIERAVTQDGKIGIVIQDSFYKAIHLDLQTVVVEMMAHRGRHLIAREDYPVRHLFAQVNPAARRHLANRSNSESLLVFT